MLKRFPCIMCLDVARHATTHYIDPNSLIFGPILPYAALNYVTYQLVPKDHALVIIVRMQQTHALIPHAIPLLCQQ